MSASYGGVTAIGSNSMSRDGKNETYRDNARAERKEAPELPSAMRSTFSLIFKASHPLPPDHMRKTPRANSIFSRRHGHFLSPFLSSLLALLSFFDLWTTTINSGRNHAAAVCLPLVLDRSHSFLGTIKFSLQSSTFPV